MTNDLDLSYLLNDVLFGFAKQRFSEIDDQVRLVHYTSAEAAMKIIQGDGGDRSFWLRNATEMNDFSEVQYGQFCLHESLRDQAFAERFKAAFDSIDTRIIPDLAQMIDAEMGNLKANTYLLSLSLHRGDELSTGRLSMWRAYGGNTSVCMVLNSEAFGEQDAYDIAIHPVMYDGPSGFMKAFQALVLKVEENCAELKKVSFENIRDNLKRAIDFAVLSTKHPSFREEEEWRLIYRPSAQPELEPKIVCINGIVQTVFLLPLKNVEVSGGNSVTGASLPELLERLIIGPTPNPQIVSLAFWKLLNDSGLPDATSKVVQSFVPLRR